METDRELISAIGRGDDQAFGSLYQRYRARLYRYALSLTCCQATAEDVIHDVFLNLISWSSDQRIPENVPAFLYAAVRNRCYDLLKRPGAVAIESLDPELLFSTPDDLERIEKQPMINKALFSLPPEQREVLVLKIWHGMEFKEIASLQQVPLSTALSRYQYALKHLRKALGCDE